MEAPEWRADTVVCAQPLRPPSILGQDRIARAQRREGPRCHVVEVADGGGDEGDHPIRGV